MFFIETALELPWSMLASVRKVSIDCARSYDRIYGPGQFGYI